MKSRVMYHLSLVCGLALLFSLGCGDEESKEDPAKSSANQNSSENGENVWPELTEEEKAEIAGALANLSDDDRALATKQFICPVLEGPLGKMGTPVKVMVPTADGGETPVFICCEGCRTKLLADPETHLAKLPK